MSRSELPPLLLSLAALFWTAWRYCRIRERTTTLARQLEREETGARRPTSRPLQSVVGSLLSPRVVHADTARLLHAGIDMPPEALWVYRIAAAASGSVLAPALGLVCGVVRPGILPAVGAAAGLLGVDWRLSQRARQRRALVRRDWPGFLYRLRLCILAGMPLPAALEAIALLSKDQDTPLYSDLVKTVRKVRSGLPCERAISEWAEATGCGEVAVLAGAVERSRTTGVPLAATVEAHHRSARARHRLAYLTWLNALPSRLSVVAMIFFLPAVLIIVLVPNVLSFLRASW